MRTSDYKPGLWKHAPLWQKASLLAIGLVVLIAVGSSGSSSSTSQSSSPSVQQQPKPTVPASETDARGYIKALGADANRVQASVAAVQVGVIELQKAATQANLDQVAQLAQQAHDNLDGVRQDFAQTTTQSGDLGNAQLEVFTAANDLKNAMGALVAYTGNPNPATLAHFTTAYQAARSEWNDGVSTIWRVARLEKAPTL